MTDHSLSLDDFSGIARLFPLPNLVFFPHVMQPLHIFEPRYRQMTADALDDDRLIALVLPKPGWEKNYAEKPDVYSMACLGKILAEQKMEDGRYNLLLRGLSRIRIVEELPRDTLYRQARVELLDEIAPHGVEKESIIRRRLLELAPRFFTHPGEVNDEFRKLLKGSMPLGALADIVTFALPLDHVFKQELLEELDVENRLDQLLTHLQAKAPTADKKFPPDFSVN